MRAGKHWQQVQAMLAHLSFLDTNSTSSHDINMIGVDSSEGFMEVNAMEAKQCGTASCTIVRCTRSYYNILSASRHCTTPFRDSLQLPSEVGSALFSEKVMKHHK